MRLPEYPCPHCERVVTLIPLDGTPEDRHECGVCRKLVSLQPDGVLALVLPRNMEIDARADAFELRISNWFSTFGIADRAMCFRVERDSIAWSKVPLLRRVRFSARWNILPRARVRDFDWRMFETGRRGTNEHVMWLDFVFVEDETSELESGHHFDESLDGAIVTTLLRWAHDHGVPRDPPGGEGYRTAGSRETRTLRVVTAAGRPVTLSGQL